MNWQQSWVRSGDQVKLFRELKASQTYDLHPLQVL
jgi:hypothetical protein